MSMQYVNSDQVSSQKVLSLFMLYLLVYICLTLLHSERPKLYGVQ